MRLVRLSPALRDTMMAVLDICLNPVSLQPVCSYFLAVLPLLYLHVDNNTGSLFMPASNKETRQPQESFGGTSFLGGARTRSPEPLIKDEFPPGITMADVTRYSPRPCGTDNSLPNDAFEEELLNQAKQGSNNPLSPSVQKYTKRRSADSKVTKPTTTRRQSVSIIPKGMVRCNGCREFYDGVHSRCLGSTDATKRCLRHSSARREKKASELAAAQALQAESEQ
jgi:hypothetical protein